MDIAAIAQRGATKAFSIAASVMIQATFELSPELDSFDPSTETYTESATIKKTKVLSYRDKWARDINGNMRTEMLVVQPWTDGTRTPTVNDIVNYGGLSRRIMTITSDPANATWVIELQAPSAFAAANA
jgi:hypothetical protein